MRAVAQEQNKYPSAKRRGDVEGNKPASKFARRPRYPSAKRRGDVEGRGVSCETNKEQKRVSRSNAEVTSKGGRPLSLGATPTPTLPLQGRGRRGGRAACAPPPWTGGRAGGGWGRRRNRVVDRGRLPPIIAPTARRTPRERPVPQNRRRRSNRPGNSQAKGPRGDGALESGAAPNAGAASTEGESRPGPRPVCAGQSLRSSDRGGRFRRRRREALSRVAMRESSPERQCIRDRRPGDSAARVPAVDVPRRRGYGRNGR